MSTCRAEIRVLAEKSDLFVQKADVPPTLSLNQAVGIEPLDSNGYLSQPKRSQFEDWGESPDIPVFYGRQSALVQLRRWLPIDHCRLVALIGMGGIGKTALAATVVDGLVNQAATALPSAAEPVDAAYLAEPEFDFVLWRSLINAPPLSEILQRWVQYLSNQ